jgi:hypothetical protein
MPSPINNDMSDRFVQPSNDGIGSWLKKRLGGISQAKRERDNYQLQLDLHAGKADVDTFHRKERATWEMATKDAGAELGYDRAGREIERGIGAAPRMEKVGLKGFDTAGRPDMQATGQKQNTETKQKTNGTVVNTPPKDRGGNPARKAKERNATQKDVVSAMSSGGKWEDGTPFIDKEQAADLSPTYARNLGKKAASDSVTNPDSAATPTKVRKPRTPKAGA